MASAWKQLDAPGRERDRSRQIGFANAVLTAVHGRLAHLTPERFLQITGPLHARVPLDRPGVILAGHPA